MNPWVQWCRSRPPPGVPGRPDAPHGGARGQADPLASPLQRGRGAGHQPRGAAAATAGGEGHHGPGAAEHSSGHDDPQGERGRGLAPTAAFWGGSQTPNWFLWEDVKGQEWGRVALESWKMEMGGGPAWISWPWGVHRAGLGLEELIWAGRGDGGHQTVPLDGSEGCGGCRAAAGWPLEVGAAEGKLLLPPSCNPTPPPSSTS